LRANAAVVLPFALQYAGFTSHLTERVRRPIVVVNAR
jgi:hypothetical protein